ncbi:MAG TPA: protein kinase [Blastocatellia bacterium]|nr:protein kinase [Blastocatellia bacterium]
MKQCVVCGREFDDKIIFCVYDGTRLEAIVVQPAAGSQSDLQPFAMLLGSDAPLGVERAARIAMSLCDALEEARRQGDGGFLTPQNILIEESSSPGKTPPKVKLKEDDAAGEIAGKGKENYLSPEAAQRQPTDAASDVYSVAAILYEMLTGRPPFKASSPAALVVKQLLERPRPPKDLRAEVPAKLQEVILRALEKEPAARQQSLAQLKQELASALSQPEPASPALPPTAPNQVSQAPEQASPILVPGEIPLLACPQCANPIPPGTAYCAVCGAAIPVPKTIVMSSERAAGGPASEVKGQQDDPTIGRVLAGRYRLVAKRGQGTTGAIYKAEDTRFMNRPVAVKIYNLNLTDDPSAISRLDREARVAARLSHPNAVAIYDFGEAEDGVPFVVTEYIEGQSLAAVAKREKVLALDRVVRITGQIADVLNAAHSLGMIHRDLNLNDVMVYRDKNNVEWVKVIDFGLSSVVRGREVAASGPPPPFMSPEQLAGEPVDARSDLYSLAAIVYRLLTGILPFGGKDRQEQITKRLTETPRPMSLARPDLTVPLAVERVIMKALARNPDERHPSILEFARDFEGAYLSVYGTVTGQAYIQPLPPPLSAPLPGLPAPPRMPPPQWVEYGAERVSMPAERPASPQAPVGSAPQARASKLSTTAIVLIALGVLLLLAVVAFGVFTLLAPQAVPTASPPPQSAPGTPTPPTPAPDIGPAQPSTSSIPYIIAAVAAIVAIGGIALFLFLRRRRAGAPRESEAIEQPRSAELPQEQSSVAVNTPTLGVEASVALAEQDTVGRLPESIPPAEDGADDSQPTFQEAGQPVPSSEALRRCPVCETQFPGTARFCVHDGAPLEEMPPPRKKDEPSFYDLQTLEPRKECPKCGTDYPTTKKYCRYDGEKLVEIREVNRQEPTPTLMEPILIGQYSCFARLGEGGMGVVYKARHVHLGRVCAVKVLLPQVAAHEHAVKLFRREAQLASSINHPNSVTIYDFGELEQNLLYLAMEFIQGRSLAEIITPKGKPPVRLPVGRVLNILRQICDALDTAHRAGIVHRDLKPQNVMVCERPDKPELVKVVDFGIARSVAGQSGYETIPGIIGTPAYMSPEQASGAQDLDGRTDIFSLGVMAYQMLSGELPFPVEGASVLQQVIRRSSLQQLPTPLSKLLPEANIPAGVEAAIMRALEPDREKRIKSAAEFMAEMEKGSSRGHAT